MFDSLLMLSDGEPHTAAMNMAIDEALLESAEISSIRFYRWDSPALSFGYFGKYADVANFAAQCDVVRRWTGGGIVFHGDDLTYSIVIPAGDPLFNESTKRIYEKIHHAIQRALGTTGQHAELATATTLNAQARNLSGGEHSPHIGGAGYCFASAVQADLLLNGRKIAGAAQRRTRRGLLQQGSIQGVYLGNDLPERFARELSQLCREELLSSNIFERAREIAQNKYANETWLRKR